MIGASGRSGRRIGRDVGRRLADDAGQASCLGPFGSVELPGDRHGALDQAVLDVVAGL
jgi:hypothetical protein